MTTPLPASLGARFTRHVGRINLATSEVTLADAARDRRDWAEAARLYGQVLARGRDRADLLVQLGNCLKESGRHRAAIEAYARALRADPEDDDAPLQFAHLLKISGNPAAARHAYARAASLGSADARAELDAADDPARWPAPWAPRGLRIGPARAAACRLARAEAERQPAALLEDAAQALLGLEQPLAARACLDMAAILQGFGDLAAHQRLALHAAGMPEPWPGLPPGIRPHADGRALLRALVRASIADGPPQPAPFLRDAPPAAETGAAAVPMPVESAQEADPGLAGFLAALHAALAGAAAGTAPTPLPASLTEAIRLHAAMPPRITHPVDADDVAAAPDATEALLLTAWRVLHNLARDLAADLAPLLAPATGGLGPHCLGILARGVAGGPPLYRLAGRASPAIAALDADLIEDLVGAMLPEGATEADHRAHAERVGCAATRALGHGEVMQAASLLAERGWTPAARLAVADAMRAGSFRGDTGAILEASRVLKHAGAWESSAAILQRLVADNPEEDHLLTELAIVQKTCGQFHAAAASLNRLLARRPEDEFAERELLAVLPEILDPEELAAWVAARPRRAALAQDRLLYRLRRAPASPAADPALAVLPPGILAETREAAQPLPEERIEVLQAGWLRTADATLPRLAGIVAIRVRVVSRVPIAALRVRLSGRTLAREPAQPGARPPGTPLDWHFTIFNLWIDVASVPPGRHELQLYVEETGSGYRTVEMAVEVGGALPGGEASDAVVPGPVLPGRGLVEHVNALPSVVRSARRGLAAAPAAIRRVLILRADQLGDVVASIPAMLRLREMLPEARFYGLCTPATRALLEGLGMFEAVGTVALAYDHRTKRRHLAAAEARRLRTLLAGWAVDLAVDLSPGTDTRPLLRLAGAACTAGFKPREFPWLNFGLETVSRDAVNGRECMSHQSMVSGFVEALGTALLGGRAAPPAPVPQARLAAAAAARTGLGLPADARLVVMHCGARLDFKRWPAGHFVRLAQLATAAVPGLHVLLVADAPLPEAVAAPLAGHPRIRLAEGHLDFDAFQGLLASCEAFIGNDTGPKHLAAHLGAPVISLHMGQVNWSEWGQEGEGEIISRRVPCCGCGIEDLADCGAALACMVNIAPEEVLAVLLRRLEAGAQPRQDYSAAALAEPPQDFSTGRHSFAKSLSEASAFS